MQDFLNWFGRLWDETVVIWQDGGWAMYAIALVAFVMCATGMHIQLKLPRNRYKVPESQWRSWIENPREREGRLGAMLDFVTGGRTIKETAFYFSQLHQSEIEPFERDLKVMKVCVGAAPLVGLLGTVTGMLATFAAMSTGSGGDKTMGLVAKGISEALITTETGLVVALPGLFFQYHLARSVQRYRAFLANLETVCAQVLHRRSRARRRMRIEDAAKLQIAEALKSAL